MAISSRLHFATCVLFAGIAGGAVGCQPEAKTGVLLHITIATVDRPFVASLDWLGPDGSIFQGQQVPDNGTFPLSGSDLATVFIEAGSRPIGARRAIVVGHVDPAVYWGVARVNMIRGETVDATVPLVNGPIPDQDGDTIPDTIDECPDGDDRLGCS